MFQLQKSILLGIWEDPQVQALLVHKSSRKECGSSAMLGENFPSRLIISRNHQI